MLRQKQGSRGSLLTGLFSYALLALLLLCARPLGEGIQRGLEVCTGLLLPSLFLFMIVSGWLTSCRLCDGLVRPFLPLGRLLRLTGRETAIFLLSLLGGYPVGARLLAQETAAGRMEPERAAWLLTFCVNCGPAFLINGVGVRMLGSSETGLLLVLSQLTAGVAVAFLVSRLQGKRPPGSETPDPAPGSVAVALCRSVPLAARAMGTVCSFSVAFWGLLSCLEPLFFLFSRQVGTVLLGLCEVTAGCVTAAQHPTVAGLLGIGLFTALGGCCVWLQIFALLQGSRISMRRFFLLRPLYAAVSTGVLFLLLALCTPRTVCAVSAGLFRQRAFSVSPGSALFLLLLTVLLLFFPGKTARI